MSVVDWKRSGVNYPVNFTSKSEWEWEGIHVTGIPDAEYPWHYDDVMMIRRLYDPGFIPLFRRIVFRSPSGGSVSFIHHGFGYYDRNREPDPRLEACLMPTFCHWPKPNVVGFWFEPSDKRSTSLRNRAGLPAPFQPWGDWVVNMCAEAHEESAREARQAMKAAEENSPTKRALNDVLEEARYAEREEAPLQKEIIESMTSTDFDEMKARASGWRPQHEAKPFTHLGSTGVK